MRLSLVHGIESDCNTRIAVVRDSARADGR